MKIAPYWKTVVAVIGAVALTVANVITDNTLTTEEIVEVVLAFLVAAGVYRVPNKAE